jgi:hypothetical protein
VKLKKPNLFIVGAAKSGTSSLASYLSQHPDIFLSGMKEPAYYVEDYGYDDWDEYVSLYAGRREKVLCDATTGYLYEPSAPACIKKNHLDAKIVIILRNPIDMAFSHWQHMRVIGNESLSFTEAISDKERAYRKTGEFGRKCKGWWCSFLYIERAMYYEQVKRYLDIFGTEGVCLLTFEEFIKSPNETLDSVTSFLGLDINDFDTRKIKNAGGRLRSKFIRDAIYLREYSFLRKIIPPAARHKIRCFVRDLNKSATKESMTQKERGQLRKLFHDDVERLGGLINSDFSVWVDFI